MDREVTSNLSETSPDPMSNPTLNTADFFLHASILPVLIIFGVLGNVANLYIFTRPSLYRSCSIYFLAGAINGLLLLLFGTTSRWLSHTFKDLDATRFSLVFCRLRVYLINVIYDLAPYFIACVTVDRYCSSSANARIRRLSTRPRIAYAAILTIITVTLLSFSHTLVYHSIIASICQSAPRSYTRFFSSFAAVYYFTAVIIILVFGVGTVQNVRAQRRRIQPMAVLTTRLDRKRQRSDGQLFLIVLVHVACYSILAVPYHALSIVAAVDPTVLLDPTYHFVQNVAVIALNVSQAIDCYVYIFTADLYRKELLILIRRIVKRPQVQATTSLDRSIRRS